MAFMALIAKRKRLDVMMKKKLEAHKKVIKSWGIEEGSERYEKEIDNFHKLFNGWIEKIYIALEEKTEEQKLDLYPYFENLSNNRMVAAIFKELTGVDVGNTNKRGLEAFNEVFGTDTREKIEAIKKHKKEEEKRKIEEEKAAKRKEALSLFASSIWDMDKIESLTPSQLGRVKKSLEKLFNFDTGTKSLIKYIEEVDTHGKRMTDNMWKWNSRRVSKMNYREEEEYEKKLKAGRTYNILFNDAYVLDVPKIVFDVLALEDKTDYDNLKEVA